jgi:dolichol-phosphate mannosyltransferase
MPRRGFDFFLIDRQVCDLIKQIQESNAYLMGLILWLGFDPQVIEYHRAARPAKYGVSMWTLSKKLKYFVDSFVAFSHLPVKLASALGMLCSTLGVGYAAFIVLLRIAMGVRVEGWASLMVAVLLLSGLQLMIIGIFGEYLVRNLDETRRRPRFIVDEVFESDAGALRRAA